MSDVVTDRPAAGSDAPVLKRLSTLDRFLPVWIVVAMAVGLGLGRAIPGLADDLDKVKIGSVSLPIAVGLLLMMYPVLAKVRYRQLRPRHRRPETAGDLVAAELGHRPRADVRAGLADPAGPARPTAPV